MLLKEKMGSIFDLHLCQLVEARNPAQVRRIYSKKN